MHGFMGRTYRALPALSAVIVLVVTGAGTAQAASSARAGDPTVSAAEALRAELAERGSSTAAARVICYRAHVANVGWQSVRCDGAIAGTTGQSRAIEALEIAVAGVGGVCANAHLQDVGWQGTRCAGDGGQITVGTTGQSRRMEALAVSVGSGSVAAQAHVQDIGWMSPVVGSAVAVGTTGRSLRLEAIGIDV
jgi:uncharacterized protein YjdB